VKACVVESYTSIPNILLSRKFGRSGKYILCRVLPVGIATSTYSAFLMKKFAICFLK
jgi:hypothetical protein